MNYYTTIEQSKKLLELGLNPDTADMLWELHIFENPYVTVKPWTTKGKSTDAHILPCWSLGALMELMPKICEDENDWYKSPIDAAFKMVIWLLENGYIKTEKK